METVPLATFLEQKNELKGLKEQIKAVTDAQEEKDRKALEDKEEYKTLYTDLKGEHETLTENYTGATEKLTAIETAQKEKNKESVSEEQWEKIKDWSVEQQSVFVGELKINEKNPPKEPGKPGMTPAGDFGGYETLAELSLAVARGVPGAREAFDEHKRGQG